MLNQLYYNLVIIALAIAAFCSLAHADCTVQGGVKHVYFGDLHTHTSYSLDAYGVGARVDPAGAFLFAKKQKKITLPSGVVTEIDRPLDFLAVTDHSEFLDYIDLCTNPASALYQNPQCVELRILAQPGNTIISTIGLGLIAAGGLLQPPVLPPLCQKYPEQCKQSQQNMWQKVISAANAATDSKNCSFTGFVAQEWSYSPGGNTLHRNIVFADDHVPAAPIDAYSYPTKSDMWNALEKQCTNAGIGCDVLAIPHNANLSNGMTYDSFGKYSPADSTLDRQLRAKYEKLTEIHQHKGNSECLIPNQDDAQDCSFETGSGNPSKTQQAFGYVRSALSSGIQNYPAIGFNALKMGFVGATDTHNATPGNVKESTWPGHGGEVDGTPKDRITNYPDNNPGGITGVWAEVNTRPAIFAALKRRETFATSGPHISLNFSQTFDQSTDFCNAEANTSGLTPMGGTMQTAPAPGVRPRFVVKALKDTNNLAQIDIIKASLVNGAVVEHVYPFYKSTKKEGDSTLCKVFTDSSFQGEPGYWYARVLEVPSPRWSHYDCLALKGANPNCKKYDVSIQERAWSSPIWNLP